MGFISFLLVCLICLLGVIQHTYTPGDDLRENRTVIGNYYFCLHFYIKAGIVRILILKWIKDVKRCQFHPGED